MGSRSSRASLLLTCCGWLAIGISAVGSSPAQESAPPTLPGAESPEVLEAAAARARAEAELAKARAMRDAGDDRSPEVLGAWLRHAEEAARLDPTWDEAAFERIWGLRSRVYYRHRGLGADIGACQRLLDAAEDYLRQFPDGKKTDVYESVSLAIGVAFAELPLAHPAWLDEGRVKVLEAAQRVTDHAFAHAERGLDQNCIEMMPNMIYRGMKLRGAPIDEREAWLDANRQRCAERIEAIKKMGTYDCIEGVRKNRQLFQIRAAALAAEDGRRERAVALLTDLQARVDGGERLHWRHGEQMHEVWKALNDAEALEAFARWGKEHAAREVVPLRISWPTVEVLVEQKREHGGTRVITPTVRAAPIRFRPTPGPAPPLRPLAEGDGRLYVVMGGRPASTVGYLPLDAMGGPVGESDGGGQPVGADLWNSLRELPPPPADVQDAHYLHGKLYLAMGEGGILVFDPKTNGWTHHAIGNPLPGKTVDTIFPLGEHKLFCMDREFRNALCCVFDLQDGRVTYQRRLTDQWVDRQPVCLWWRGDDLLGFSEIGLVEGLPKKDPRITPFPAQGRYGWSWRPYRDVRSMVELGSRRFFTDVDGLHEFDGDGRILRSWHGGRPESPGAEIDHFWNPEIDFPPDSPTLIYGAYAMTAGGKIYLAGDGVLGFDPADETWYGPLRIEIDSGGRTSYLAARDALWIGTGDGLLYLDLAEFHRRAQETDRVMTTGEFRRRRDEIIASRPPLERAKFAFAMRRLDEAKELLDALLAADPNQAEALLLSAYLYERWCLDEPEEAIRYYRRLAEVEGNPGASLAGLLGWSEVLVRLEQWQATDELCTRILTEHPRLSGWAERNVWYRQAYARKKMEEKPEP